MLAVEKSFVGIWASKGYFFTVHITTFYTLIKYILYDQMRRMRRDEESTARYF